MQCGDNRAGRELFAEALAAFKVLGNESGTAMVLRDMAEVAFADGHPEQALRLASDALELLLRGKHARGIATTLLNSAAYRIALGNVNGAREAAREALHFARQAQDELNELNITVGLQHLAVVAALDDDSRRGAKLLGYVDAQYGRLGTQREPAERWGYEKLVTALREKLSEDEIAKLAAEGAAWSEEQAVEEALTI
jgi:tetratricopeptide repeat protein